jgi:transposase
MYIKTVRKKNGVTDKRYEYLHLVENIRTPKGPRQQLILNLGKLDLKPEQYDAFVHEVERRLKGQTTFMPTNKKIERHAQDVVRQIFKKQAKEVVAKKESDYQLVDTNSYESEKHVSIGPEYLCLKIWEQLGLDGFLNKKGITAHNKAVMKALIIGRLIEPGSELNTSIWAENRSAIYEIAGYPIRPSLISYYRTGDQLYKLKDELEGHLRKKEQELFGLSEKIIFYDLTNTYLEGVATLNKKAKRGRSKEKRSDCKLLTLGMVVDEQGFSKYSKLFKGNVSEGQTLPDMIEELNRYSKKKDQTVVLDAGIATEKNISWLKANHYHYIVVNRGAAPIEKDYSNMEIIRKDIQKGIEIKVKCYEQKQEMYILCYSKQREIKEQEIRSSQEDKLLKQLKYYKAGLSLPRRTKQYAKVVELVGRAKEKYSKAAKLYTITVMPEENKSANNPKIKAIDLIWKKKDALHNQELQAEGSYILRTDRTDLADKEVWQIYIMLTKIENAFRNLKSHLGLRPIFHQKENRADAHMFISVLAYHILHIIEFTLKQNKDHRSWSTIRDLLSSHKRFTLSYLVSKNNQSIQEFVRMNSKLEPDYLHIYKYFGLSGIPLPKKISSYKCSDHTFKV